jgi:hypothetical protein
LLEGLDFELIWPKTIGGTWCDLSPFSSPRCSSSALIPALFIIVEMRMAHSCKDWFFADTLGIFIKL